MRNFKKLLVVICVLALLTAGCVFAAFAADEEGTVEGTMISVLYDAVVPVDATEVGIEVSVVNGTKLAEAEKLAAAGVLGSATPKFAIALVEEGLTSFGYTPYYIDAEGTAHYGVYKVVNTVPKAE